MKLKVAYCTTTDGFGKDETKEINAEDLKIFSGLPFGTVKAFSIHKQDNNLIDCVCSYLAIEPIQLFYIEFV